MHLPTLYYILGLVEVTTNHLKKKEGSKPKRRSLFAKSREGGKEEGDCFITLYLALFSSLYKGQVEER